MRYLLGALIVIGILLGGQKLLERWKQEQARDRRQGPGGYEAEATPEAAAPTPVAESLPGLPPQLEASLAAARRQGADALKTWLNTNRRSVQDPRLAAIELDYVVMVAGKNFGEAREVFGSVKARTPTNSPIYGQLKRMERNYQ